MNALRLSMLFPVHVSDGTVPCVPVKAGAELVPVAVSVCVCVPSADPVNAGTPKGHATVPEGVKFTVALVGTPAGHAIVPAGVMEETPPAGLEVVAETTSPAVGARADPPVAVDVITWVPVVTAVVPPCTLYVTVTECV